MAITLPTDMKVYNDQIRNAYVERIAKAIIGFVERARGAIIIEDATVPGDYIKESFFKFPSGLVTRRIATGTGADSDVTPVTIEQGENVAVKLQRKIGPVQITDASLKAILRTPQEFGLAVGEMAADGVMGQMIADGLMAAVAALNRSPYVEDVSGDTSSTLSRSAMATALALMGDHAKDVVCWVMHSKPYFDLVGKDLDVSTALEGVAPGVALYGADPATLGRPCLVIDDASLTSDETVDKYFTLGLTPGALHLSADSQFSDLLITRVGGKENLTTLIQGERDWALKLKGFTYNVAGGGANPADAALATATNWTASSSSAKHRAGVCIKST
jgi:hypothetical protein